MENMESEASWFLTLFVATGGDLSYSKCSSQCNPDDKGEKLWNTPYRIILTISNV